MKLRRANPADLDLLIPWMVAFNAEEGITLDPEHTRSACSTLIHNRSLGVVLVATVDGADVGYAVLTWGFDLEWGGRDAFLTELWVDPGHRGGGHGRELLDATLTEARQQGAAALHLMVRHDNEAAIALYVSEQFVEPPRRFYTRTLLGPAGLAAYAPAEEGAVAAEQPDDRDSELSRVKPPFPQQHQDKPGLESELDPRPRYQAPEYRPAGKLRGKVALVTGGDSGIGRAVAVMFAREGADVAIVYLPAEQTDADETRRAIEDAGQEALLIPGDLTDGPFCHEAVDRTIHELGHLDILVNNAAFQQHQDRIEDLTDEQWERTFQTNITGYFRMARAAVPYLQPGSAIINTGSITGLEGSAGLLDYAATKGAIHAFTKSLAKSLLERGIRVNCVAPGPPEEVATFGADTPLGRPAQPEEVAPAYVFFASDADSSFISGEVLTLLGGATTAA